MCGVRSQCYNEQYQKMSGHYHKVNIIAIKGKDRGSSFISITASDGFDLPRETENFILQEDEELQRRREKEHTDTLQPQGSRENYGPPTIKYQANKKYDKNADGTIRAISSIDRQLDQGVKYVGVGDVASIKNQEVHYEKFKATFCNRVALNLLPDCCGLLSAQALQEGKMIVAPIGFPLDKYFVDLRTAKSALEPLQTWFSENTAPQRCFPTQRDPQSSLVIARIISDLMRYINCCHAEGYSFLDASADNFIIVCRRPE